MGWTKTVTNSGHTADDVTGAKSVTIVVDALAEHVSKDADFE